MQHPFPYGSSHIEFAIARGEIDYWLHWIAPDTAYPIRFYMDFLYGALARYLESKAVLRLFAQASHQNPTGQQASQGSRGGGAGTMQTLRLLHHACGHCGNPVNMFSCNNSTDHGV